MPISTIGQNGLQQSQIISAVNMPTGSVIQVVSTVYTTQITTSSNLVWTNSGCTCSITPQFSTSRILVSAQLSCFAEQNTTGANNLGFGMRLVRSGTTIWTSSSIAAYFYTQGLTSTTDTQICQTIPVTYLDSPSTTSSITYSTQGIINTAGTATLVMQYGGPAVITLQEIR